MTVQPTEIPDRLFEPLKAKRLSGDIRPFLARLHDRLEVPERLTVTQWADRYRRLSPKESPHAPGPWETGLVPYLRKPMDAFSQPTVERITLVSATRMGKTELLKNCFCYTVDQMPINLLLVLPDKVLAKDFGNDQMRPLFETCPRLQGQIPEIDAGDGRRRTLTTWKYDLRGMFVWVAYASSASTISSRTIGVLLLDEIRGFPASASGEGSPLDLARERTETFDVGEFKVVEVSSAGVAGDALDTSWKQSDREQYHVPCPHCGTHQVLAISQIRLPKGVHDPDRIRDERLARYECIACAQDLPDDPIEKKREIIRPGIWVPPGGSIEKVTRGEAPPLYRMAGAPEWPRHIGFQISRLYSPWPRHTWSSIAARDIESNPKTGGTLEARQVFTNTWLAEAWEQELEQVTEEDIQAKDAGYTRGIVPIGGRILTAFVDVQLDYFYFVIRAWGERWTSWLILAGMAETFEDLAKHLSHRYPHEDLEQSLRVTAAGMDIRYRGGEVLKFCRAQNSLHRASGPLFIPMVGLDHIRVGDFQRGRTQKDSRTGRVFKRGDVRNIDTTAYKDKLKGFIEAGPGEEGEWHIYEDVAGRYLQQMSSEQKVPIMNPRTGKITHVWRLKKSRHNHYWDCEVGALAVADIIGLGEEDAPRPRRPMAERRVREGSRGRSPDVGGSG